MTISRPNGDDDVFVTSIASVKRSVDYTRIIEGRLSVGYLVR